MAFSKDSRRLLSFGVFALGALIFHFASPKLVSHIAQLASAPISAEELEALTSAPSTPGSQGPVEVVVEKGDTFVSVLKNLGVSREEAHLASQSIKRLFNPRDLNIGHAIEVSFDQDQDVGLRLASLTVDIPDRQIEVMRDDGGDFIARSVIKPQQKKLVRVAGQIHSSFAETAAKLRMPANVLVEAVKALSYDVDFQRDLQPGDRFEALYEAYLDQKTGRKIRDGNLLYVSLHADGKEITLYRHATRQGQTDYLTPEGKSVRKALLRTPIDGARISSGFGIRRHPVLGYSKAHRGVDFAAPTGTPIYAAGDGKVEFMGKKNGYGNYVLLRHNAQYATAYAHISRFGRGMRAGRTVRQGEVIAYVGSTGMATGPHLHYETLVNGAQVNPLSIKIAGSFQLGAKELGEFKREIQRLKVVMQRLVTTPEVASY